MARPTTTASQTSRPHRVAIRPPPMRDFRVANIRNRRAFALPRQYASTKGPPLRRPRPFDRAVIWVYLVWSGTCPRSVILNSNVLIRPLPQKLQRDAGRCARIDELHFLGRNGCNDPRLICGSDKIWKCAGLNVRVDRFCGFVHRIRSRVSNRSRGNGHRLIRRGFCRFF